jgi:hypothetical protein
MMNRIIPYVVKHDRCNLMGENNKKYCNCDHCKFIRKRYNQIYKSNFLKKFLYWLDN